MPYVRHEGLFNSNNKLKDVDNLAFGLAANLYPGQLLPWLNASFSLRGEYLTDTANDKEVYASELVVSPFAPPSVDWPIHLGRNIYFDPVGGGPSMRFDLSGRVRYGHIESGGPVATLQSQTDYFRTGFKASAALDLGGSDAFSGVTLSASYLYFHNVEDASKLKSIERVDANIGYALTQNVGLTVGYQRGRNEDSLQQIDKIIAAVTIKFGEPESYRAPSFK